MKMNREYANELEKTDFELFQDFNNYLKLLDLGQCPYEHHSDASGLTRDGRHVDAELKFRNQVLLDDLKTISGSTKNGRTYTASTIFIEGHKIADMLLDYVCLNREQLYVNFLNDDVIILFNVAKLKHRPNKVVKKIYSELYQSIELAKRQELDMRDAWIYKKINNEWVMVKRAE